MSPAPTPVGVRFLSLPDGNLVMELSTCAGTHVTFWTPEALANLAGKAKQASEAPKQERESALVVVRSGLEGIGLKPGGRRGVN